MWIKICGITDPLIAVEVAKCGPDAIGLNFYEKSPRQVTWEAARQIVKALPSHVKPVGVFVNSPSHHIESVCELTGLGTIQLHGDEPPEFLASVSAYEIVRAFRIGTAGLSGVGEYLEQCRKLGVNLLGCLVEAHVPGTYGGTGHVAPWELLQTWNHIEWPPLILAGGLNPNNVGQAIATVQPSGVDVASGVELSPGKQSLERVKEFIAAARAQN